MQGIRPQQLTNQELLDYAHLTGYDKIAPEWVEELAKRLANPPEPDLTEDGEAYQRGYDYGYEEGYADGVDAAEDDLK